MWISCSCRNRDKLCGQVSHRCFYFVAFLTILRKQFTIRFYSRIATFWEHQRANQTLLKNPGFGWPTLDAFTNSRLTSFILKAYSPSSHLSPTNLSLHLHLKLHSIKSSSHVASFRQDMAWHGRLDASEFFFKNKQTNKQTNKQGVLLVVIGVFITKTVCSHKQK